MQSQPRQNAAAVISASLSALVFMVTLACSVADINKRLGVALWFCWHVIHYMLVTADCSRTAVAKLQHAAATITSWLALIQSLGFAILALVKYTREPDSSASGLDNPQTFLLTMTGLLALLALCNLVVCFFMTRRLNRRAL